MHSVHADLCSVCHLYAPGWVFVMYGKHGWRNKSSKYHGVVIHPFQLSSQGARTVMVYTELIHTVH